jgi:hypothetical protein
MVTVGSGAVVAGAAAAGFDAAVFVDGCSVERYLNRT